MSKVTQKKHETPVHAYTTMKPKWEYVTVAQANVWVRKNEGNRGKSWRYIRQLARDMVNGDYKETHEGIAIDKSGNVVDGQHRLEAIILANRMTRGRFKGLSMWVFYDVDRKAMDVINSGRKRGFSDHMRIRGIDLKTAHGTIANILMGNLAGSSTSESSSTQERLHFIEKHCESIKFAAEEKISPGPVAAVVARAYESRPDKRHRIREFVEVYKTGRATGDQDWAATTLRDYIRSRTTYGATDRVRFYVAAELCLSAFLDNYPLTKVLIKSSTFKERFLIDGEVEVVVKIPERISEIKNEDKTS